MTRCYQVMLIVSFTTFSWLGFMIVHEFGHVVAAWLTDGSVSRVVLHPLQIPWTALWHNPHPQMVAWGGPTLGSLLPLGLLLVAWMARSPGIYLHRFFAGFCLIANGLYLAFDTFLRGGDGGTLLQHGASQWQLLAFSTLAIPYGFWMCHGLGPYYGLGAANGKVSKSAAIASAILLAATVAMELVPYW